MTDEIMMEVHAIKDAIGVRNGHNLDALFKEIQLGEARLKAVGVKVLAPPRQSSKFACHCIAAYSLRSPKLKGWCLALFFSGRN